MEVIDQIRQAANIVEIASQFTTLRQRGRKHVGLCPFHPEKDPSFTVDEEKQLYHCFGCGAGGDVFTLVMEKENLSFPEAVRLLAEKYRIPLPERRKLSPQFLKLEEKIFKINEDALGFFKKNLFNTKEGEKALEYLQKRNVSPDIIQKLKIGYALNTWDSLLSCFKGKGIDAKLLEKAGLVIFHPQKNSYYDRFRGRIIFPIFDLTGKPVAFGGRTIVDAEPKYLNSPDTPVYTKGKVLYGLNFCKEAIREKGEAIFVEGYTDFLALYQAGITNVTASLGTSLTANQVALARRFAPRMIVSYDADRAGQNAAIRAISLCFAQGVEIRVLNLPPKFDPDSFIQKHGGSSFQNLVEKSTPGLKFLINIHLQGKTAITPEEKAKIVRSVMSEIEKMPDPVIRSEYIKQTGQELSIEERVLRSLIQKSSAGEKKEDKDDFLNAEKRLFQILLEDEKIAAYIFPELKEEHFQGLKGEPIFTALSELFRKGKTPCFHELKEKIDPSLLGCLSRALLEKEQASSLEEAFECLNTLKQLFLENQARRLGVEIARLEKKGESEKIPELLRQIQETKKQLSLLSNRNYLNLSYNNRRSTKIVV